MRATALAGPALLLAGGALLAVAVGSGAAQVGLFVVVPFVIGSSPLLALGILLLVLGVFLLPWTFAAVPAEEPRPSGVAREGPASGIARSGGVVLVGPVPIFFGGWRAPSRRAYWLAVAVGSVCLVLFVVAWWLAVFA